MRRNVVWTILGSTMVLVVGIIDYTTGTKLSFSIFYVFPIALVAWFSGRNGGILLCFLSAIVWLSADMMAGDRPIDSFIPYWNTTVRLGFFLIIAVILSRLRKESEKKAKVIVELQASNNALKVAEQQLDRKAQELVRSNTELEQFAYSAAHDLRQPLIAMGGFMKILLRRYSDTLDSDAKRLIESAEESLNRMETLISDLLAYARVESKGKAFERTDVNKAFTHALSNLQNDMEESGTTVTSDDLPIVYADEGQLVQLFQNLIGNAVKFRGSEIPHIRATAQEKEDEALFSIHDNGIGIDSQHIGRIFGIFQRVPGKTDYPGTGIGLAICRKIVERHGGRIWAESQPGKGSTFYFTLPKLTKMP